MILNISKNNSHVIERGVYYFGLTDYPNITISELKNIIAFIKYEKTHGRHTEIECQDENILQVVKDTVSRPDTVENILLPTENAFIYHATDLEAAQKILSCGKLLSAEKFMGKLEKSQTNRSRRCRGGDPAE
jgi:hypothetical protein